MDHTTCHQMAWWQYYGFGLTLARKTAEAADACSQYHTLSGPKTDRSTIDSEILTGTQSDHAFQLPHAQSTPLSQGAKVHFCASKTLKMLKVPMPQPTLQCTLQHLTEALVESLVGGPPTAATAIERERSCQQKISSSWLCPCSLLRMNACIHPILSIRNIGIPRFHAFHADWG